MLFSECYSRIQTKRQVSVKCEAEYSNIVREKSVAAIVVSVVLSIFKCHTATADVCLQGCDPFWTCKSIPAFRRNILSPSSRMKIAIVRFSETLESTSPHSVKTREGNHRLLPRRSTLSHRTTVGRAEWMRIPEVGKTAAVGLRLRKFKS
jgi:hypothetical protein